MRCIAIALLLVAWRSFPVEASHRPDSRDPSWVPREIAPPFVAIFEKAR
jgi:hypothetical protein